MYLNLYGLDPHPLRSFLSLLFLCLFGWWLIEVRRDFWPWYFNPNSTVFVLVTAIIIVLLTLHAQCHKKWWINSIWTHIHIKWSAQITLRPQLICFFPKCMITCQNITQRLHIKIISMKTLALKLKDRKSLFIILLPSEIKESPQNLRNITAFYTCIISNTPFFGQHWVRIMFHNTSWSIKRK